MLPVSRSSSSSVMFDSYMSANNKTQSKNSAVNFILQNIMDVSSSNVSKSRINEAQARVDSGLNNEDSLLNAVVVDRLDTVIKLDDGDIVTRANPASAFSGATHI